MNYLGGGISGLLLWSLIMNSFKNGQIGSFVEQVKKSETELGYPFHYNLIYDASNKSSKIKRIAFFLTDEQSRYDREALHDQLIHYERILSLKDYNVIYHIYEIGTNPILAPEVVLATLIKNKFDLLVPVGDYVADVLSSVCYTSGMDPKINFVNVENAVRTRMVGINGEALPNRTGVMRIPPSYDRQIAFLKKYKSEMKNILMLQDDHYTIVPVTEECETLRQTLQRYGFEIDPMVIMSKMDVTAQLIRCIADYDGVIIDHSATIARTHILEIVRLCNMNGIPLIATEATSVYMGAAIGFGHNGYPYGKVAVSLGAQVLLGNDEILVNPKELYEDENLVFNDATRRHQGIQVDRSTDAALYARSISAKYEEHFNSFELKI